MAVLDLPADRIAASCAALIGDALRDALKAVGMKVGETGRVCLMLSGGRTPAAILPPLLARDDLDWDRIDVVASDERLVPRDDPASTEGMVRALFAAAGRHCRYHGFGPGPETAAGPDVPIAAKPAILPTPEIDPDHALTVWRAQIAAMAWPPAVAFLGMGDDGHTASLFPGRTEAGDADLRTAAVPETPPHPAPRLTFGAGALAECRRIVLVANSVEKSAQLARAMLAGADPRALPVTWLCRLPQTTVIRRAEVGTSSTGPTGAKAADPTVADAGSSS